MNPRLKYRLLKEAVIIMGMLDYVLLFWWGFFTGQGSEVGLWLFGVLMVNYYCSSKLGYTVLEMLVRIQNGER